MNFWVSLCSREIKKNVKEKISNLSNKTVDTKFYKTSFMMMASMGCSVFLNPTSIG